MIFVIDPGIKFGSFGAIGPDLLSRIEFEESQMKFCPTRCIKIRHFLFFLCRKHHMINYEFYAIQKCLRDVPSFSWVASYFQLEGYPPWLSFQSLLVIKTADKCYFGIKWSFNLHLILLRDNKPFFQRRELKQEESSLRTTQNACCSQAETLNRGCVKSN